MNRRRPLRLAAILLAAAAPALADDVSVERAYAIATTPSAPTGAVYLSLVNRGAAEDALTGVASDAAERVELHDTVVEDGVAKMRPAGEIALPPGAMVEMAPGGLHVMMMGLVDPLKAGETVRLDLSFDSGVERTIEAEIVERDAADATSRGRHGDATE